jgi:multidrug efflux pump subunit AcrA (membrane-fusion protein)
VEGVLLVKPRAWVWGVVIGLGVLSTLGCSREKTGTRNANASPAERRIAISAAQAEGQDVQRSVLVVGTLLPREEVTLGTEVAATVAKTFVELGDRVRKGDLVIKLDDRAARLEVDRQRANLQVAREALDRARKVLLSSQANVERAQAVLADARINFKRLEGLFGEGAISASQRDSAQTQYDVAVASLRAAEAQVESDRAAMHSAEASVGQATVALEIARKLLQDTDIVSPIDGSVRKRFVNVGDTFKEKTPLVSLVMTDSVRLQGEVPERFAPLIAAGRPVQIEVEAYPGQVFPSSVTRVSPSVDVESRSFTIEASVPNPKGVLKPGFFARATIVTGADKNVPFVPEEAVVSFAGIVKVYVIADGKAEERQVKTGVRRDGRVEILQGIRVGETIATSGLNQLATGTAVSVQTGSRNGQPPAKGENRRPEGPPAPLGKRS